jgi:hypothetical protein
VENGPSCLTSKVHVTAAARAMTSVAEVLRCDNVSVARTPATIAIYRALGLFISEGARALERNDYKIGELASGAA